MMEQIAGYCAVKAKFHYAILVADRSETGRRPAANWDLAYQHELAGLRPASDLSATRMA